MNVPTIKVKAGTLTAGQTFLAMNLHDGAWDVSLCEVNSVDSSTVHATELSTGYPFTLGVAADVITYPAHVEPGE